MRISLEATANKFSHERINTPFYSLPSDSHIPIRSKLAHIGPFSFDDGIYNNCNIDNCRDDTITTLDTNVSSIPHGYPKISLDY